MIASIRTAIRLRCVFCQGQSSVMSPLYNRSWAEIKTTTLALELVSEEHNLRHWAQAQCYAHMLAQQENLDAVGVHLTYYHLDIKVNPGDSTIKGENLIQYRVLEPGQLLQVDL